MTKIEKHYEICNHLHETYMRKNADYGDSFGEMFHELGIITAITRIGDKYNRIKTLAKKPEDERAVKDESIRDTILDMANYCIMTIIEIDAKYQEVINDESKPISNMVKGIKETV